VINGRRIRIQANNGGGPVSGKAYFALARGAWARTPVLPEATLVGVLPAFLRRRLSGTKRLILITLMFAVFK
jgi:hypothetical protein